MSMTPETIAKIVAATIQQLQTPSQQDEWQVVTEPMKTKVEDEKAEQIGRYIKQPARELSAKKPLIPLKTETFLDDFFLDDEGKLIGGVPSGAQISITGLPGAGKSILIEEIAVRAANNGHRVLYVTGEDIWQSPAQRFDLQSRLINKTQILGFDWAKISQNIWVIDVITTPEMREWKTFAETYRYCIEANKIDMALIDSVTVLEAYRGALKYRLTELSRFNQLKGVTGFFVHQRSSEDMDKIDVAGGVGITHTTDVLAIVDHGEWYNPPPDVATDLGVRRQEYVRFARLLESRLSNFTRRYRRLDIIPGGFLRQTAVPTPSSTSEEKQKKKQGW